jgi:hypothetical protein
MRDTFSSTLKDHLENREGVVSGTIDEVWPAIMRYWSLTDEDSIWLANCNRAAFIRNYGDYLGQLPSHLMPDAAGYLAWRDSQQHPPPHMPHDEDLTEIAQEMSRMGIIAAEVGA